MSDLPDMAADVDRILERSAKQNPLPANRAAMRCALGDACEVLDILAERIGKANKVRGGYIKKRAQEDAALLTSVASILWSMRERTKVYEDAQATVALGEKGK